MGARRERMSGVERVDREDGEKSMGPEWGKEDMVREVGTLLTTAEEPRITNTINGVRDLSGARVRC